MYGQLIDMQTKLRHAESQLTRRKAKLKLHEALIAKNKYILDQAETLPHDRLQAEANMLDAEADKLEVEADIPTWEMNLTAAKQELKDIEDLMLEIKPMCKYADLPILEMSEASQEDEWLGELKQRAENFLMTAQTIPHDHFQTMRMHPKFKQELIPHIQAIQDKMSPAIGYDGKQYNKSWSETMLEIDAITKPLLAAPTKAGE